MMKMVSIKILVSVLAGLSSVNALDFNLRGKEKAGQFSCTISGADNQDTCDASTDADGSNCVWCSLSSFGVCVSQTQAEAMKKAIPGLQCDDDENDDDYAPDDDAHGSDDDSVPDDYWKCLKDYEDAEACSDGGCTWCDTKAGYGVCLDKEAAESASESDWFDCKTSHADHVEQVSEEDPYDPSCLAASLQGDEATCEATLDQNGDACEWCTVASSNLCLTSDQAEIAEQIGADCSSPDDADSDKELSSEDPYDPSCLAASLQGDEATCEATLDQNGDACEWCTIASSNLCLTSDQAEIAEQIGADCEGAENTFPTSISPF